MVVPEALKKDSGRTRPTLKADLSYFGPNISISVHPGTIATGTQNITVSIQLHPVLKYEPAA